MVFIDRFSLYRSTRFSTIFVFYFSITFDMVRLQRNIRYFVIMKMFEYCTLFLVVVKGGCLSFRTLKHELKIERQSWIYQFESPGLNLTEISHQLNSVSCSRLEKVNGSIELEMLLKRVICGKNNNHFD